jgi:transposase-like protein
MQKTAKPQGRKGQKGGRSKFDISFRRRVAKDYIEGDRSLLQVAEAYGIAKYFVKDWVKYYKKELAGVQETVLPMTEQELKDKEALQKQLGALQKKLEHEQMKNFALETMIDLAKEELGVDIRKNSGAKQPGK